MTVAPTSISYISQGLRLRYADWGNPNGRPLVLLHGGCDHARSWDWVAKELCHDWNVIAPDLRGHGDSDWSPDGQYGQLAFLYDLAQLVHQLARSPIAIVGHSFGAHVALNFAGAFPEMVSRLVAIEGLGLSPAALEKRLSKPVGERIRDWADARRALETRVPRRYATLHDAYLRMKEENQYLSDIQARHLTVHGAKRNEDGTYSWKFDNYLRLFPPFDIAQADVEHLWGAITCPTLLMYGEDSWASNPQEDGRIRSFRSARVSVIKNAGHWLHHDQFDQFMSELRSFL